MERVYKNGATVYNRALHTKENPYTKISNKLLNDSRLNFIERGLMSSIISNGDTYILNTTYLQKQSGLGVELFYFTIYYLRVLGYLSKKRIQSGVIWVVNEEPKTPNKKELEMIYKPIYQDKLSKRIGFNTSVFHSNEFNTSVNSSNEINSIENHSLIRTNENKKELKEELIIKSNFSDLDSNNTNLSIKKDIEVIPISNIISTTSTNTNYNLFGFNDEDHKQLDKKYKEVLLRCFKLKIFTHREFETLLTNIIKKHYPHENNIKGFVLNVVRTKSDFYSNLVDIVSTNKDLINVLDYPD